MKDLENPIPAGNNKKAVWVIVTLVVLAIVALGILYISNQTGLDSTGKGGDDSQSLGEELSA